MVFWLEINADKCVGILKALYVTITNFNQNLKTIYLFNFCEIGD
jgi:hypothetical protein